MEVEANVLLCKCNKTSRMYGVRVQKMKDGDWWRTWAFKIKPANARSEGYDATPIQGSLNVTAEYPGCPYCGTLGFVQCGVCKKITCHNGEESLTCQWCGRKLENFVTAEKFDVDGGGF